MESQNLNAVELEGVSTNNLKNISAVFPLERCSVVTGVSGSGKSSLVFDTLYGESYHRYVESLSSYARQYLKALPRPKLAKAKNLPPSIALKQWSAPSSGRSTVGTLTELTDSLRVIFAYLSRVHCYQCGSVVKKFSAQTVAADVLQHYPAASRILILAPLSRWQKITKTALASQVQAFGFSRFYHNGQVVTLEDLPKTKISEASIVVDRITVDQKNESRIEESLSLAFKAGRGEVKVVGDNNEEKKYYSELRCANCDIFYKPPTIGLLNFNHPEGACPECQGFGSVAEIDPTQIFPDLAMSISDKSVACWNFGKHIKYYTAARTSAKKRDEGLLERPFQDYGQADWQWLWDGDKTGSFKGINGYFRWLDTKKYKPHYRIHAAKYRKYVTCPACKGQRINKYGLACRIANLNISEVGALPIERVEEWIRNHVEGFELSKFTEGRQQALQEALQEVQQKLSYLKKVGVEYISLNRQTRTLSGGEFQRVSMAKTLGSNLTETLFCLDEPTSGLHPKDSENLWQIIDEIKQSGNTVVMVEHERAMISRADHVIEIGPGAGHVGGQVVYQGPSANYGNTEVEWSPGPEKKLDRFLKLTHCRVHNLKDIEVAIPVGALTGVCGVSGSGKTSLVHHSLFPLVKDALNKGASVKAPISERGKLVLGKGAAFSDALIMSQGSMGKSSRSNIATYLGIYSEIRNLLAATPLAKAKRLTPSHFSFNVVGGRCEICKGLGYVIEDLSFLGDLPVTCSGCQGLRFTDDVLAVTYRGKNLIQILSLTVSEARELFFDRPQIAEVLDHVLALGVGYISLGQAASDFSGGEAQRIKILSLLGKIGKATEKYLLVFDEPSTGLSDTDVKVLVETLRTLCDRGHTVVVIEHHVGVLKSANWLIELGPGSGEKGGDLVFQGKVGDLKKVPNSPTSRFL
ncbi:MAG: excinuclease ABC subunit UvrA [Oligoflexales bacterium]